MLETPAAPTILPVVGTLDSAETTLGPASSSRTLLDVADDKNPRRAPNPASAKRSAVSGDRDDERLGYYARS